MADIIIDEVAHGRNMERFKHMANASLGPIQYENLFANVWT
jgi:hypothetical protein